MLVKVNCKSALYDFLKSISALLNVQTLFTLLEHITEKNIFCIHGASNKKVGHFLCLK